MDLVTRFDGIVRQLNNLREPVTPAQLYHRFLEASLQSKGTHHQLLATAIYTNPVPLTYDQMKIRFEKSALQHAPGAAAPPAARDATEVNYVGTSTSSSSYSHGCSERLSRLEATRRLKIRSNPSRISMCIHHHRFVNGATRRNFTLPTSPIPLQLIVPQTTR
jgi:hypothetical protein